MGLFSRIFGKSVRALSEEIFADLLGASSSASGVSVTPNSAMYCATVYACVRVRSESLAQLPLILYERRTDGGRVRASGHRLYSLLHDAPNDWQTSFDFWEMCSAHLDLRGKFFAFISRNGRGEVIELLPIHPDAVTVRQDPDTLEIRYQVSLRNKARKEFAQNEIFYVRGLTLDGVNGVSPITHLRETIGLSMAAETFGSKLFANGARPSGILTHPGKLLPEQKKALQEKISEAHSQRNSHTTMVMDQGMKWEKVVISAEDSQFLDTRKYQRSEIAGVMRTPLHKIGDLDRSTNNNIEHQDLEFWKDCLAPTARRITCAIWQQLLSPSDRRFYYSEFLFDSLLRGDLKSRAEAQKLQIESGTLSPDEAREQNNLNKREDGRGGDYWRPANFVVGNEAPADPNAAQQGSNGNGKSHLFN